MKSIPLGYYISFAMFVLMWVSVLSFTGGVQVFMSGIHMCLCVIVGAVTAASRVQ